LKNVFFGKRDPETSMPAGAMLHFDFFLVFSIFLYLFFEKNVFFLSKNNQKIAIFEPKKCKNRDFMRRSFDSLIKASNFKYPKTYPH
jgi:hypothetical protein